MVPSPYYATFKFDLGCRSGVVVRECEGLPKGDGGEVEDYYPTEEYLEREYQRSVGGGEGKGDKDFRKRRLWYDLS